MPVEGGVIDDHEDDVIGRQTGLVEVSHLPAPRLGHRQPDDQVDDGLQNEPDQPDYQDRPVLQPDCDKCIAISTTSV